MELQVLLNEYESLVKLAVSSNCPIVTEKREVRAWNVYKFLIECGVDKLELTKIEEKYNF